MVTDKKKEEINLIDKINQKIKAHESLIKLIISILGIFATILAAYLGAYLGISGAENQRYDQNQKELKTIANGYLSDIAYVDYSLSTFENSYFNKPDERGLKWEDPIYPDWGLYYSNRQDIGKFGKNISQKMYNFYNIVLTAEFQRKQFNNYDNEFPINFSDSWQKENRMKNLNRIYTNMAGNINESRRQLNELRTDLLSFVNS